jgi:uncharacterized protein
MESPAAARHTNRLAAEASAYLRQHAHNPVDWYPWGEEALARARAEDKPILLSIGYSACHWCHVMERESFEDPATALVMNTHYVCIKVDREERPDLDQLYQTVVQMLRQSGGWPLTVFLTPEQKPFFAGTYFPPEPRYGMRSFREILAAVRDAYDSQRGDVALQADEITRAIAEATDPRGRSDEGREGRGPAPDLLERAARRLSSRFDDEHGGFGQRPKFPNTMAVEVLIRQAAQGRDGQAEARARRALDGMRAGGIWDHLGGGFHRYSTDERWLVPHFEKMLYDNAQLMRLYTDAARAFDEPGYAAVARHIASYLLREMQSPEGGFYATQDADSEGEEGKFFVWRPSEIDAVVSDPLERQVLKLRYGVTDDGNFEHTGASVLHEAEPLDRVAIKLGRAPSEIAAALERGRRALLEARELRPRPFRDEKILACWNGLAISALAELGASTGDRPLIDAAARAFAHLERALIKGGRVDRFATLAGGEGGEGEIKGPGYLDDHADVCLAALDLYEATGEPRYVLVAREIADQILARFHEEATGELFFAPSDGEALIHRTRDPYDQATPSGAAMAATALLRLGALFGDAYARPAERYLTRLAPAALENPFGFGQTLCALDTLVRGSVDVVIVTGGPVDLADPRVEALRAAAFAAYLPGRTLAVVSAASPASVAAAPLLAEGKPAGAGGAPVAYVCRGRACSAPVSSPEALASLLRR